jgi:hypothetical protein
VTKIGPPTKPWWWINMSPYAIKNLADAFIVNRRELVRLQAENAELRKELAARKK